MARKTIEDRGRRTPGDKSITHERSKPFRRLLISPLLRLPRHEERQVRYFSMLLITILIVGTLLTVSYLIEVRAYLRETALDHALSIGTLLLMGALYAVNRAGHFRLAASSAVVVAVVAILGSAIPQSSTTEASMLSYLTIPIVLSGLILSVRFTVVISLLSIFGVLLFPFLFDTQGVSIPLSSTVLIGAFVVVAAHFRTRVEADRRAELHESEERFAHLATHDSLTGLPNRNLFDAEVESAVARAKRSNQMLSVVFVDVDNFKDINDALGHTLGDELLRSLGGRLRLALRESDLVSRPGGDEFLILAESITSAESTERVVEKIMTSVHEPLQLNGHDLLVTASIGVSVFPDHGSDPSELVRKADVALYRAKASGKDKYAIFSSEMSTNASHRLELASDLARAVEAGEISVLYQPQVEIRTGSVAGVECLSRWNHPTRGVQSPAQFIPLAEQSGLITQITHHVLALAVREVAVPYGIRISVNVSERDLRDDQLLRCVEALLHDNDLNPQLIEIELTENIVFSNLERSRGVLSRLKALGISLAVDDFGAGYATLRQIADFPLDTLKIDRSFIQELSRQSGNSAIVAGVVGIAGRLGMQVVAEGVELEELLSILAELGCTVIQGWYFSKAVPAAELAGMISSGFGRDHW